MPRVTHQFPCPCCGRPTRVRKSVPRQLASGRQITKRYRDCRACGVAFETVEAVVGSKALERTVRRAQETKGKLLRRAFSLGFRRLAGGEG